MQTTDDHPPQASGSPPASAGRGRQWVRRNAVGWGLILSSFVLGPLIPGPSGLPLFLVGLALISFPGKRRVTARVLRGRPVRPPGRRFGLLSAGVALVAPAVALLGMRAWWPSAWPLGRGPAVAISAYAATAALVWVTLRLAPPTANLLLRLGPVGRRLARPLLLRFGVHQFFPPRRRHRSRPVGGPGPDATSAGRRPESIVRS